MVSSDVFFNLQIFGEHFIHMVLCHFNSVLTFCKIPLWYLNWVSQVTTLKVKLEFLSDYVCQNQLGEL